MVLLEDPRKNGYLLSKQADCACKKEPSWWSWTTKEEFIQPKNLVPRFPDLHIHIQTSNYNILHLILLTNTIILRQKHINRNTKRKVNIQSCNLTPLPLMDSLSLLSGSIHNPGWRFCHLLSLLPRASIINRWLVEVTGAASVGEKQVEARGSSYHSEKNTDRLSKAETAEKSGRDAEFRVAGRRSEVNKQRIKGNWKWQQQEWKGGMWGTKEEVGVVSVQRQTLCLL